MHTTTERLLDPYSRRCALRCAAMTAGVRAPHDVGERWRARVRGAARRRVAQLTRRCGRDPAECAVVGMDHHARRLRLRLDVRVRRALIDTPRIGDGRKRGCHRLHERKQENERSEPAGLQRYHRKG